MCVLLLQKQKVRQRQLFHLFSILLMLATFGCSKTMQSKPSPFLQRLVQRARVASKHRKVKLAVQLYRQAMKLYPNDLEVPLYQAQIIWIGSPHWSASKVYLELRILALFLDPTHPWRRRWHRQKSWRTVVAQIEQTLRLWAIWYYRVAQATYKDSRKVEQLYDNAQHLYSEYCKNFANDIRGYKLQFLYGELLYRKARKLQYTANKLSNQARLYFRKAAQQYRKVLKLHPGNLQEEYLEEAVRNEISCYEALLGWDLSTQIVLRLSRHESPSPDQHAWEERLASLYELYFNRFRKNDGRLAFYLNLGILYARRGKYQSAALIFSTLQQKHPHHYIARVARHCLALLRRALSKVHSER